jgi:Ser/Thr protein kinase RdoA (MazF antagonist)
MSATDLLDSAAADVLRHSWGITAGSERVATGTSRDTWSIEGAFWLSHSDLAEETPFRREAELLHALPNEIARCRAHWQAPEVVPTMDGRSIATSDDGVWRVTRHLPGAELDPHDPATYSALASMLAELHATLGTMPESLRVREQGIVEVAPQLVERYTVASFSPASEDARESFVVRAMAEWLKPRIGELAGQPRQLTHGDWIPPNVKVSAKGWGVLDWEFCRVDPIVMDLAQSCCTLLIWSGLNSTGARIDELVQRYSVNSGRVVSLESVQVAMALYWLHNYHHWRERHESIGRYKHKLARQPGRLFVVGKFVGAVSESAVDG